MKKTIVKQYILALRPTAVLGLVALTAAATLSIGRAEDTAAARAPQTAITGVNYHPLWAYRTTAERRAALDQVAGAGVRWLRIDMYWKDLEPRRGRLDPALLGRIDTAIAEARARRMQVLGVLWGTPPWASGKQHPGTPPKNVRDFARFAGVMARRYRGRVAAWQLWNEPNQRRFFINGTPAYYVKMLRASYPLVHPHARVVFAGLTRHDARWLRRAYAAGAKGTFDVMAVHPYPQRHDARPEGPVITGVKYVRAVMVSRRDPKPIWFTELGWSTYKDGVTEPQQASYLLRSSRVLRRYPYVQRVFWFTLNDWPVENEWLANLGLVRADGTEKPAFRALRGLLRG